MVLGKPCHQTLAPPLVADAAAFEASPLIFSLTDFCVSPIDVADFAPALRTATAFPDRGPIVTFLGLSERSPAALTRLSVTTAGSVLLGLAFFDVSTSDLGTSFSTLDRFSP